MLSPPLDWVRELTMIQAESGIGHDALHAPVDVEAAYLRMLAGLLTSSSLMCEAAVTQAKYLTCMRMYIMGGPWPKLGTTMAGHKRLQNVATLLLNARSANVSGSYVECGVWRGGMSIFAKAVIEVYQMQRGGACTCVTRSRGCLHLVQVACDRMRPFTRRRVSTPRSPRARTL